MQTSAEAVYLDSSALVKLVWQEPESAQLEAYLSSRPWWVSCALAQVEVVRAARAHSAELVIRARALLRDVFLIRIDDQLLADAAEVNPLVVRSLDAIHLAAARRLGRELASLVTYDRRMAAAARAMGLPLRRRASEHPYSR